MCVCVYVHVSVLYACRISCNLRRDNLSSLIYELEPKPKRRERPRVPFQLKIKIQNIILLPALTRDGSLSEHEQPINGVRVALTTGCELWLAERQDAMANVTPCYILIGISHRLFDLYFRLKRHLASQLRVHLYFMLLYLMIPEHRP